MTDAELIAAQAKKIWEMGAELAEAKVLINSQETDIRDWKEHVIRLEKISELYWELKGRT